MAAEIKLDELKQYYRLMWLIRRFEEECGARLCARQNRRLSSPVHRSRGDRRGGRRCAQPDDYVITTYRDHGHALARGMSSRAAMAELFGKDTGCSRGFGGSMHMFDAEHHFYGGHGIVGGHLALAAGVAFKIKYLEEKRVCMVTWARERPTSAAFTRPSRWPRSGSCPPCSSWRTTSTHGHAARAHAARARHHAQGLGLRHVLRSFPIEPTCSRCASA